MKLPGCIIMIFTFTVLAFFFMYIPDIRLLGIVKHEHKKNTARDLILCGIITLIYSAVAFSNLGTLTDPETFVSFKVGDSVILCLNGEAVIDRAVMYTGINTGKYTVEFSEDGERFYTAAELEQDYSAILKWQEPELVCAPDTLARYIRITAVSGSPYLGETAFFSKGVRLAVSSADDAAIMLCDEQEKTPEDISYLNSSYFDEVYHVRTAVEHMDGMRPYEISHPPLGKILISLGMLIFGRVPFGWRFMGTLFGVIMLPAMYSFIKKIDGAYLVPACGTVLLASGFMHFTQTRIATVDTYAVFFIIMMYSFMYRYICDEKKSDLALSGIFFGIGAACKWTCIFAGAGLAVIWLSFWIYKLFFTGIEMKRGVKNLAENILWCVLFFVLIPAAVYYVSYYPYGIADGMKGPGMLFTGRYAKIVAENQRFMLTYHEGVTAGHPYSSKWYQWILDIRPILYYLKYYSDGRYSSIADFTNPVICWGGLAAMIMLSVIAVLKREKTAAFIVAAWLSQLIPWLFVKRVVFEYHYFPASVFLVLALSYLFSHIRERKYGRAAVIGFTAVSVALFILFYPVISGMPVNRAVYSAWAGWLPTWPF
ncbi:MAG: glycosyltransferase family 39 protein [Oscillospiraceae bacterium]|nr:glycosyltransferase family 39 protein [Oscillospiraceae bacterium]